MDRYLGMTSVHYFINTQKHIYYSQFPEEEIKEYMRQRDFPKTQYIGWLRLKKSSESGNSQDSVPATYEMLNNS